MKTPLLKVPIFVALDVDSPNEALKIAEKVQTFVGGFKLGPRLMMRSGASLVRDLSQILPVFVDQKFFDIPSTMEASVRAAFEMGASFATVHALAGLEALKKLGQVQSELNRQRPFQILVVTVLTSFNNQNLPPGLSEKTCKGLVQDLTKMSLNAGLDAFVCSAEEVSDLRRLGEKLFLVTPGIRLQGQNLNDQSRVNGPKEALDQGASALVVGRPICEAQDPAAAAKEYYDSIITAGRVES